MRTDTKKSNSADIMSSRMMSDVATSGRGSLKYAMMLASASLQEDDSELLAAIAPNIRFFVSAFAKVG